MRLELSPQMYFSGYITLQPPPTFLLPVGTNIIFKLSSEYDFIDLEVRLKVSAYDFTTNYCVFEATVSKTEVFNFSELPCT